MRHIINPHRGSFICPLIEVTDRIPAQTQTDGMSFCIPAFQVRMSRRKHAIIIFKRGRADLNLRRFDKMREIQQGRRSGKGNKKTAGTVPQT